MSMLTEEQKKQLKAEERRAALRTIAKMASVLVLPFALLIYVSAETVLDEHRKLKATEQTHEILNLAASATAVITELQRERGLSAGYLASDGNVYADQLSQQREATDTKLATAWAAIQSTDLSELDNGLTASRSQIARNLENLAARRAQITDLAVPMSDVVPYYTEMIMALLNMTDLTKQDLRSAELLAMASALDGIQWATEFAGRERAAGAQGFGVGQFSVEQFQSYTTLQARQLVSLDRFRLGATAEEIVKLDAFLASDVGQTVERFRDSAVANLNGEPLPEGAARSWFQVSTEYIDGLGQFTTTMVAVLDQYLDEQVANARNEIYWTAGGVSLVLVSALVISLVMLRSLTSVLVKLTRGLQRLARGETDVRITGENRHDIIGHIAHAVKRIVVLGEANAQVRSSLDISRAQIMITDTEGEVMYINGSLKRSFALSENYFQEATGGNDEHAKYRHIVDLVSTTLEQLDQPIDRLVAQTTIDLSFDDRIFDVAVTPVADATAKRVGHSIEWREVTATRQIESQLAAMIEATKSGDFSGSLQIDSSEVFLNVVADGLNSISAQVNAFVQEFKHTLVALSDGDLTRKVKGDYTGDLQVLAGSANTTVDRLHDMVASVASRAEMIDGGSQKISGSADQLARSASQTAAALEETAASMEEISKTVESTATAARGAAQTAKEARDNALQSSEIAAQAVTAMREIEASSTRIGDIVSVIDEISFQTNLLALNAAVEAARAGDAGRGFSVVAAEVRSLAQRSTEAAQDIKQLIEDSNANVGNGVKMVEQAGDALGRISETIELSTTRIAEISTATQEVSVTVGEINQSLTELDSNTQKNAKVSVENSAQAQDLADGARALKGLVGQFSTQADVLDDDQHVAA